MAFSSFPCWKYDVFLSFRDEVLKNFLSHLCCALEDNGFRAYKDEKLERGFDIATELQQAIEQSRIAMVMFSKNYADSEWCLDELVKILDCRQRLGQIVLPIFFNVDPSDVRNKRGSFGDAFARHQGVPLEKVEKWKNALTYAANLAGFYLQQVNGDECELIKKIIEELQKKLSVETPPPKSRL